MEHDRDQAPRTAAARVLALMVSANGHADPRELQVLERLDAYARLGLEPRAFLALVQECVDELGGSLAECSWLRARDQAYVDHLIEAVTDPRERLLVGRLAAAVLTADGQVSGDERLVFDHVLSRWRITRSMLTEAILSDPESGTAASA